MDIYTKVFFINLILGVSAMYADKHFFDDKCESYLIFNLWALIMMLSIPVWMIYMIARYT